MFSKRIYAASLIVSAVLATSATAGTITVDFLESAAGVTISGSGSFDTTGLSEALSNFDTTGLVFVSPAFGSFGAGAPAIGDALSAGVTYTSFGPNGATFATSGSGDAFGLVFCGTVTDTCVMLPDGYASNDQLAFSAEFAGQSFASLGITETNPISLAIGDNTVNLTFTLPAAVPLPPALPLLGGALLGIGAFVRRTQRPVGRRQEI